MNVKFTKQLNYLLLLGVMLFSSATIDAQQGSIKGIVTDINGQPIVGASVTIEGSNKAIVTDIDGKYVFSNLAANAVQISASFIGYLKETQSVTIPSEGSLEVNFVLVEDLQEISEVVVIGYGSVKKSDLTGAVTTVSSKEIQDKPVTSLDMALQGKVAGVDISSNSGSPGSASAIRIRGTGTITNSDPIFVVDGLIMDAGAISFLNTSDIENISVLKDASATAIYGAKGANGVIMVTTKKGNAKGGIKVNLNAFIGQQQITHFMDLMNGPTWAATKNLTSEIGDIYDPDTVTSTDWLKEVTRKALMYNTNLSFSGGNELAQYFVSVGYVYQDGVVKRTNFDRSTIRINTTMKPKKWLSFEETFTMALHNRKFVEESNWYNGAIARAIQADPITPIRESDGSYALQVDGRGNPIARMETGLMDQRSKDARIAGNLVCEITLPFIKGLSFRSAFGGDYDINEYRQYTPAYSFGTGDAQPASSLSQNFGKTINWQWENYATYQKTFGQHSLVLMAGTSASSYEFYDLRGINRNGAPNVPPSLQYFDYMHETEVDEVWGSANHASQSSLLSRLNYSFMDRYLLTASIRRDGSSKFGADYKYGIFPSFAVAWKVTQEEFMKNLKFINELKIHAGWGETGNDKIGSWTYEGIVTTRLDYAEGRNLVYGSTTLSPSNPTIRWETTKTTNVGFDAGLLDNRLLVNFEYFIRNTEDMLAQIEPPLTSGIPTTLAQWQNIGKVRNKGFELSATYRKRAGDFTYEVGANITRVVNKVIDLGGEDVRINTGSYGQGVTPISVTEEGMPIGSFYGFITEGIFQNYGEVNAHAFQNEQTAPGDFKFKDINGDGIINNSDRTFIGTPFPNFSYGMNFSFAYKFVDLTFTIQGVKGGNILTPWKSYTHNALNPNLNLSNDLANAWTPENHSNEIPRIAPTDPNSNRRLSTYFIEDASYMRIKTGQIGFTLPQSISSKLKIDRARFYIGGQNLLTFTKYSGNDPEIGLSQKNASNLTTNDGNQLIINADFGVTPQPRMITLGFDLTF